MIELPLFKCSTFIILPLRHFTALFNLVCYTFSLNSVTLENERLHLKNSIEGLNPLKFVLEFGFVFEYASEYMSLVVYLSILH